MTQFYASVAKVVGLEAPNEGHREVTWQQFVEYLLATSPEKDVSELGRDWVLVWLNLASGSALEILHRPVFALSPQLHLCCPPGKGNNTDIHIKAQNLLSHEMVFDRLSLHSNPSPLWKSLEMVKWMANVSPKVKKCIFQAKVCVSTLKQNSQQIILESI